MELGSKNRAFSAFVVAALVLTLFAGVLTLTASPAKAAAPFRSFNIGIVNMQVTTYNPLEITLVDEYVVVYNIYSTLITYDKDYQPVGDLAYSWELAPDQTNWTFHLVQGAYFTNPQNPSDRSHPVTAADVAFSYNLNINQTGSIFNSYTKQFTAVWAPDPTTIRITTRQPFAAMYSAASAIPILPQYIWGGINNPVHYNNNVNPIGSGAMYYDSPNGTFGSNIILRRNPNYYGATLYCQSSRPDQVYFKDYSSASGMVTDFQSGTSGLDAIMNIDPASFTNALASWSPKFTVDTGFVGEISLNVMSQATATAYGYRYAHSDLTNNFTFRKAVAMSIDKQALVDQALLGYGQVADTLVPDSNPWHYDIPANQEYPFDPQAARQMLMQAGWAYDSGGAPASATQVPLYNASGQPLSIRFYTLNTASEWQQAAILIQGWLAQTGIQTTDARGTPGYQLYSINQLSSAWFKGDYDMWIWDWVFTPASDPSLDVMEVETTGAIGPTSDNYYTNATYDALYEQSLTTVNQTQRRVLTDQLQKIVYDYASYILPYYRLDLYAATNGRPNVPAGQFPGWTNYGNWSRSVGLTPDSDLPNLWFQLSPLDNQAPQIQALPPVSWINGSAAPISVTATDPEGATLTYDWDFGDGTYLNGTTNAAPSHAYALPGNYTIRVRAADSEWPVCASTTARIEPYVPGGPGQNLPPSARVDSVPAAFQYVNKSITFNLTVSDANGDPVYVTWAFGDGATGVNYATNATVHQTHTYATADTYIVRIVYSDNKTGIGAHTGYVNLTLAIQTVNTGGPPPTPQSNPWLDYGVPIAIVLVIVVAVAAILVRRRSLAKKEEAEEGKPPQGAPPPPPPSR